MAAPRVDSAEVAIAPSLTPTAAPAREAAIAACVQMRSALAPLIGDGGVAALFRRAVHLAAAERPWLLPAHDAVLQSDFAALRAVLATRSDEEAAAAHAALLAILTDLLGKLIGPALAQRLLSAP